MDEAPGLLLNVPLVFDSYYTSVHSGFTSTLPPSPRWPAPPSASPSSRDTYAPSANQETALMFNRNSQLAIKPLRCLGWGGRPPGAAGVLLLSPGRRLKTQLSGNTGFPWQHQIMRKRKQSLCVPHSSHERCCQLDTPAGRYRCDTLELHPLR